MAETLVKWTRERPGSSWRRWSAAGLAWLSYLGQFTSVHLLPGLFLAFMGKGFREKWDTSDVPLPGGSIVVMGLIATLVLGASVSIFQSWRARIIVLDTLMLWIGLLNSLSICVIISLRLSPVLILINGALAVVAALGVAVAAARHVLRASLDT